MHQPSIFSLQRSATHELSLLDFTQYVDDQREGLTSKKSIRKIDASVTSDLARALWDRSLLIRFNVDAYTILAFIFSDGFPLTDASMIIPTAETLSISVWEPAEEPGCQASNSLDVICQENRCRKIDIASSLPGSGIGSVTNVHGVRRHRSPLDCTLLVPPNPVCCFLLVLTALLITAAFSSRKRVHPGS